jgi:hypothetical protein
MSHHVSFDKNHPSPWVRWKQHLTQDGLCGALGWAANWVYWNGQLYRIEIVKRDLRWKLGIDDLRLLYKSRRRSKKYGITNPIIVYQMGKVGSTSMFRSLKALDLDVPVYQLHFLTELKEVETWARNTLRDPKRANRAVKRARHVRHMMQADPQIRWNLISMVRSPVPRLISSFWENIESNVPQFQERFDRGQLSAQEIIDIFRKAPPHDWASYWYNRQLKSVFDLDVFAEPFDREKGYQIYEGAKARLLLIRLEDLNRIVQPALEEFLGIPGFVVSDRNVGEQKKHGKIYHEFLDQLRLPTDFIESENQTSYALHFYTPAELEASVRRWRE